VQPPLEGVCDLIGFEKTTSEEITCRLTADERMLRNVDVVKSMAMATPMAGLVVLPVRRSIGFTPNLY
jgi:hypothetical protein